MSGEIKVDTAQIALAATNIMIYNTKINDDFANVKNAIGNLRKNWSGGSSDIALNALAKIETAFVDARYDNINQYVVLLNRVVEPGYASAEVANTDLASMFK